MRTTLNIPDDLHARLVSLSQDRRETLSRTVEDLVRCGMGDLRPDYRCYRDPENGLLVLDLGRSLSDEDVRSVDDDG